MAAPSENVFLISFLYKNIEQNENSKDKTNTVLKAIETGHLIFFVALFVEILKLKNACSKLQFKLCN